MTSAAPPFVVHCPSCDTGFPIDPGKVSAAGTAAICSHCLRVFTVRLPVEAPADWRGPAALPIAPRVPAESSDAPFEPVEGFESAMEVGVEAPESLDEEPSEDLAPAELEVEAATEAGFDSVPEAPTDGGVPEFPEPAAPEAPASPPAPPSFEDLTSLASEAMADPAATTPGGVSEVSGRTVASGAERFGRRDPKDRARHLARVLVSDIIAYYPERYRESFERGTLQDDFRTEVEKSWKEYVDQVGLEMAESTPFFKEALNEVLGKGKHTF